MAATEIERDCTCWINTICLEHVERGVAGGFTQAGHGSDRGLRRMRHGDPVVPFRRGLFTIPVADMTKIAEAMKVIRP